MKATVYVKLVAIQEDFYTQYVFKNLDEKENSFLRYITATKPPNWNGILPEINDIGFLECEYVNAGDTYYSRNTGDQEQYKFTTCYFIKFIKEKEKIQSNEYKF